MSVWINEYLDAVYAQVFLHRSRAAQYPQGNSAARLAMSSFDLDTSK